MSWFEIKTFRALTNVPIYNIKILFLIGGESPMGLRPHSSRYVHLGHEIGFVRLFLFDILYRNIIKKENITVYTLKDREFLYNHVFKTLSHEEDEIHTHKYGFIIDLTQLTYNPTWAIIPHICKDGTVYKKYEYFNKVTNNLFKGKYKPIPFNSYKRLLIEKFPDENINNNQFVKYICSCNITNKYNATSFDSNTEKFIIIHHRYYSPNDLCWNFARNASMGQLYKLLEYIKLYTDYKNIVLFGQIKKEVFYEGLNIDKIHNLEYYVSLLSSKRCKLLISSWSGAGQLSHSFFNGNVFYYPICKQDIDIFKNGITVDKSSYDLFNTKTRATAWDNAQFSEVKKYFFRSLSDILSTIKNHSNKITDLSEMEYIYNDYLECTPLRCCCCCSRCHSFCCCCRCRSSRHRGSRHRNSTLR